VEAAIGTLDFTDGYPTGETAAKLRDHLDYLHGVEAFMNSIHRLIPPGPSSTSCVPPMSRPAVLDRLLT
jgi:hypothetical protein